jgi:hypothetical protein
MPAKKIAARSKESIEVLRSVSRSNGLTSVCKKHPRLGQLLGRVLAIPEHIFEPLTSVHTQFSN